MSEVMQNTSFRAFRRWISLLYRHCEPYSGMAIQNTKSHSEFHISLFVIQRALSTTPRTKRVHSNSNRKNTFSDYEFSIFTLSWISSMLTEFRQRNSVPKASICSLSGMNAVQKFALLGLPMNLIQGRKQDLLEIFRFRSI